MCKWIAGVLVFLFSGMPFAQQGDQIIPQIIEPAEGDTINLKTWYSQSSYGDGVGLQLSGVLTEASIDQAAHTYAFTVKPEQNGFIWQPVVPESTTVEIVTSQRPVQIESCSAEFESCKWILGIQSGFQYIGSKQFFFPILPWWKFYCEGDSYRVRLDETSGFACTYYTSLAAFICNLISYSDATDATGQVVRDSALFLFSSNNPFRFGGIVAHSSVGSYIGMDLLCCGDGYYGMSILSYKHQIPSKVMPRIKHNRTKEKTLDTWYDIAGRRVQKPVKSLDILIRRGMHHATEVIEK